MQTPRTSQPRTSRPRTSQPRTSQPRTSQPRTSEPGGGGEGWQNYLELKQLLRALGDVVRLNIVHALATGEEGGEARELKVTELAERLVVSQPLISWNLGVLRRAGLVRMRRQGREVYCSLDARQFQRSLGLLADVAVPSPSDVAGGELAKRARDEPPARGGDQPGDARPARRALE